MNRQRLLIIALLLLAVIGFYASGAHSFFTLDTLQTYRSDFQAAFQQSPWQVAGMFFAVYVVMTALSLPGATLLTLLGGRTVWIGLGAAHHLVCQRHRRDARLSAFPFSVSAAHRKTLSPPVRHGEPGRREGWRVFICSPCVWCPFFRFS